MRISFLKSISFLTIFIGAIGATSCIDDSLSSGDDQLKADVAAIDSYLSIKGIDAFKDASGIRFTIDSLGSGYPPSINSSVNFKYTGKLLSGTVFQTGVIKSTAINTLIPGMQIGLPEVPNGSKATLYIPSYYAYGNQVQGNIPANSNLIFEIFLTSIISTSAEKTQLGADTVLIDKYITNAGLANVVKDTSGLRYYVTQQGTGVFPSWFNRVKISYVGYLINSDGTKGAKFYEGSNEPTGTGDSRVVNYIRGFQIGLQQINGGSSAVFLVPSVMAFGTNTVTGGITTVPANSSLIYEVNLIQVLDP